MLVAIADDSALFRTGVARLLTDLGIQVTDAVRTGDELLEATAARPPNVAILDIKMPPSFTDEGLRTAETLRRRDPHIAVLLLSTYAEPSYAYRLLAAGERKVGYLLKDRVDDPVTLQDALIRLDRGETVVDPQVVSTLLRHKRHQLQMERLTSKERDVLQLMAEGRSNSGIGHSLYMSPKTVEAHIGSVFTKLDLPTEQDDNRRVRAVLIWLRAHGAYGGF